jgi:hypothetical protein
MIVPKTIDTTNITPQEVAWIVANGIRSTQGLALDDNVSTYSIGFTSGSGSYTIYKNYPTIFQTVPLPSGVTINTTTIISYDTNGNPTGTPTLVISVGGVATVRVTQYTGRVTIS